MKAINLHNKHGRQRILQLISVRIIMTIYAQKVTPMAQLEKLIINTEFHTCFLLTVLLIVKFQSHSRHRNLSI